ncbi:MAG: DUF4010 domain-containing protein [Betaproteobacteria bacterium]|nr:DUF4010 domain-containing protein [Betaproteobacteria bacterium]
MTLDSIQRFTSKAPMAFQADVLSGFVTALGIGLLIGTVREKLHADKTLNSGIRTHAVLSLVCSVGMTLGLNAFLVIFAVVGALVVVSYRNSLKSDAGMTGEVALMATAMLSALATQNTALAASLGVVVASLLFAKVPLRRFSRELLSITELQDGLLLCAAILVVLPLLPKVPVDPWGALEPYALWRIVVLIMAVGMAGHVALRVVGTFWGFPLAGFFSGMVSSTAATASFGQHVRQDEGMLGISVAATLLSNVASVGLLALVLQVSSPHLLGLVWAPLLAAIVSLLVCAGYGLSRSNVHGQAVMDLNAHAFNLRHALVITLTISMVLLVSVWLREWLGETGAIASAVVVGAAEIHAAAISLAHMSMQTDSNMLHLQWGLCGVLAASVLSKSVVALVSGGLKFSLRVSAALALMWVSFAAVLAWQTGFV